MLGLTVLAGLTAAGCGSSTATHTSTVAASAKTCAKSTLALHSKGVLTVATDSPAYPPYFENNKPSNGQGFESAVAYAIANKLGFEPSGVKWTVEPFDSSYAPGPKSFDFDINEISITAPRAKEVDFSTPYYTNPQGIIVPSSLAACACDDPGGVQERQIGVQIGTTSLDAVTPRSSRATSRRSSTPQTMSSARSRSIESTRSSSISRPHLTSPRPSCRTPRSQVSSARRAATTGGPAEQGLGIDAVRRRAVRAARRRHAGGAEPALDRLGGERAGPALTRRPSGMAE